MSTVNVQPSRSARGAIVYALHGAGSMRKRNLFNGVSRAAQLSCSVASPEEFVALAEQRALAHNRKVELYCYTQNFSPEEFSKDNPEHVRRVHELGVKLAQRMNTADFMVVTHTDSAGGHLHNHIYVVNHDNLTGRALTRCRSWTNGLRQVNDELMRSEGCQVLPSPEQPKLDWDLQRERFAAGGFEQVLGDQVNESLLDPRCTSRAAFAAVLAEKGVELAETERDGLTYRMRRSNGKKGRRKASSLCNDFVASEVEKVFEVHRENERISNERIEQAQRAAERVRFERVADVGSAVDYRETAERIDQRRQPDRRPREANGNKFSLARERERLERTADRLRSAAEQEPERDSANLVRRFAGFEQQREREAAQRNRRTAERLAALELDEKRREEDRSDDFELG